MKLYINTILALISILGLAESYVRTKNQQGHINHIHSHNYVFSVMFNSEISPKVNDHMHRILNHLKESPIVLTNKIVIELIDTKEIPDIDKRYKLKGKNLVNFFIRKKTFELPNFDEKLEELDKGTISDSEFLQIFEGFIASHLNNISVHVKDLQQFQNILEQKRVVGIFFGPQGDNYEKYFHVARKNLDFDFLHSHDHKLMKAIFQECKGEGMPNGDFFAIVRHPSALNEFDDKQVIVFTDFEEKALSEFFEYERFDKLRNPEQALDIVKRMFVKSQPLLLYVKGSETETDDFKTFKEALKELPKRFIYSYTEVNSPSSSNYIQLFTMGETLMNPESLSIIWITPSRKPKVEHYTEKMDKDAIKEFVFKFHKDHAHILDSLSQHLYDSHKERVAPYTEDL